MTEKGMTSRILSDAELLAIPPIQVGPDHERNPFHAVIGDPIGSQNSYRWTVVHGWRSESDARSVEPSSPEDMLLAALAREQSGFHRSEGGSHGSAMFPLVPYHVAGSPAQRKLEEDWEARCLRMHALQGSIDLPDKPIPEFRGFHNSSIRRGD